MQTDPELQQLSPVPEQLRLVFRQEGITVLLEKRDRLLHEGESLNGIYLVETGRIRVWLKGDDNRRALTRTVNSGHLLGLSANFGQQLCNLNATAITSSRLSFISRKCLIDFMKRQPADALWIVQYLGQELRETILKLGR